MGGSHRLQPFVGVELVRADDGAHLVVEDLRRGAGQRAEPGFLEPHEEFRDRDAERRRAVPHFQRREGVHVHRRHRPLHRAQDGEIGLAGEIRMDAALHAHFGGAALPGFHRAAGDLVEIELIGPAAQMLIGPPLGEGAEAAAIGADIGVVDVAGDDIGDIVPRHLAAQLVRRLADELRLRAPRLEQPDDGVLAEHPAGEHAVERGGQRGVRRHRGRRRPFDDALLARRGAHPPAALLRQPAAIGAAQRIRRDLGIEPALSLRGDGADRWRAAAPAPCRRARWRRRARPAPARAPPDSHGPASPGRRRPNH